VTRRARLKVVPRPAAAVLGQHRRPPQEFSERRRQSAQGARLLQRIPPAQRADDPLSDLALDAFARDQLQVLVRPVGLDADEHGVALRVNQPRQIIAPRPTKSMKIQHRKSLCGTTRFRKHPQNRVFDGARAISPSPTVEDGPYATTHLGAAGTETRRAKV
jgi:hypothetical protein